MLKTDQKLVVDFPAWTVHFSGCPRLESVKPGRIKCVQYIYCSKYVYCPECQTISYIFRMNQDANIAALERLGIQYLLTEKAIFLQTETSFWKIKYIFPVEKHRLVLYHGNFKPNSSEIHKYKSSCYHKQRDAKDYRTIQSILQYIVEHDKFRGDPTAATVNKTSKGSKKQKVHRKRMKNSIKRARVKHTLDTLENLKKSDSEDN